MRISYDFRPVWAAILLLALVAIVASGCSRNRYRRQADRDAYAMIAERNVDPRWRAADYTIEIDPRSRYFDPYDPDRPPIPPDDPVSHQYMHWVNGTRGWAHWHANGDRIELENPAWREALGTYVEIDVDGSVKLSVDSALRLAYVHSPFHQSQLETLYRSALDVTTERFRLDTQFFGGYDTTYLHQGSLVPARLSFNPTLGRFVVTPSVEGVESNLLTVGRPSAGNPALQLQRRFATAGELLVGFANSFVFEFTGSDANLAASLANFSLIQPLLRGAGRDVALEQLTVVERVLLANLRAYHQFRQGFYTQIAVGELGVAGPQRGRPDTNLQLFSGQGFLGGYIGLLQQLQQIRNTEDNLTLQLRSLAQLEALLDVGLIDLVQVDQIRQSVENERANLLQSRNSYELALDRYKTGTLGLPPDLPVQLDDSLIRQFQLVAREATALQDSIAEQQNRVGQLPDDAEVEVIRQVLSDTSQLAGLIRRQLDDVREDLARMDEAVPARERTMTDEERMNFQRDREQLRNTLEDLEQKFQAATAELSGLRDGLSEQTRSATTRRLVVWLANLLRLVQRSIPVQARARLEAVVVETIELESRDAFQIALANRLDFMNGRAALVDSWRLIQFNADALQSVLNVTAEGDIRTARNNPVSFRAPTGSLRLGLEFDAPFTRLLERNAYRESLIDFQQSRRGFIQSRDALHLGIRALIRQIELLSTNLEIQRSAVAIAIRRVDVARAQLYAPVPPPLPGQPPAQFGPTSARDLLGALSSLRDTQNSFLGVWLDYYATRMRLARELGIMVLDQDGRWIDYPLPGSSRAGLGNGDNPEELPPPTTAGEWIELANYLQEQPNGRSPVTVKPVVHPAAISRQEIRRLPPITNHSDTDGTNSKQKRD